MTRPVHVAIVSLGCAKNLVDTEVMAGTLATAGIILDADPERADVLLINTCSFIADARTEAESRIREAVAWKRARPARRIVVAGCLPQRNLPETRERFPEVDLFISLDDVPRIAQLIGRLLRGEATGREPDAIATFAAPQYLYDESAPRLLLTPASFAYVKIAEGCDHGCRFCAIPSIRGRQRSRQVASVLAECRQLLAGGVSELNLIAQDTTRYGHDLPGNPGLVALLRQCDGIEGRFWLRVLYTHPRHLSEELLALFAASRRLVRYIDVPLQHISDHVLRDMGRRMGGDETRQLLRRIRAAVPQAAVRTTFIVGYPGETADDFAELLEFVRAFRFERLGVFAYSPEPGTPASRIREALVPAEIAAQRRAQLMELQQGLSLERNRALVGQTLEVLLDGRRGRRTLVGRTFADAPEVDNTVLVRAPGKGLKLGFAQVRITAAAPYEISGELA